MATIFPRLTRSQLDALPSSAEAKVYVALQEGLPDEYVVFFQLTWILKREADQARDGEADFVICHPSFGYLCLEVKGGGVGFDGDRGDWYSIDRKGVRHELKNPIQQALRAKYSIRTKLSENPDWSQSYLDVNRGHAVFFPDVVDGTDLARPDMPPILIGDTRSLTQIRHWVDDSFKYWASEASSGRSRPGKRGVDIMVEAFAHSFEVRPLAASALAELEQKRLALTRDQMRVLDLLRSHRRAAVSGGAGTGKTLLAVEKARRLAAEGFRTLLTCYNRQLADHLAGVCADVANLEVLSFHQLCNRLVTQADKASGRNLLAEARLTYPGKDLYSHQLPNALAYATEILDERYDAIVCDEGQDFREEFWVPIELLLEDFSKAPLYIFYDDNQNLYSRASSFPIRDEPYSLTTNCRNTHQIHQAAYRHYKGVPVDPPSIRGEDVSYLESSGVAGQAESIQRRIVELISTQGVRPEEIVVLIADGPRKGDYYAALRRLTLPKTARWSEEGGRGSGQVLMETVHRFKGLEATVTFVWGLQGVEPNEIREVLYVAMTRAKSVLTFVADRGTCGRIRLLHEESQEAHAH
jgi:hypothetical protein